MIHKIIIIRYGLIGDSLYSFPILPTLRHHFPQAHITMVVDPGIAGLLDECPFIDELISYDRRYFRHNLLQQLWWILARRRERYDLALVLNASFQAALFSWLIAAPERWGFDQEKRGFLLTKCFVPEPEMPQLLKYQELLKLGGITPENHSPAVWLSQEAGQELAQNISPSFWQDNAPVVLFHTGASKANKIWQAERFAATANALSEKGCRLVFIGGPDDETQTLSIMHQLNFPAINLVGRISLPALAELYRHASLSINNDSGPMHLAAFLGCPLIGLFGAKEYPSCWKPWGPDVSVFYPHYEIKPETVIDCALKKLKNHGKLSY